MHKQRRFFTLDVSGAVLALVLGVAVLAFGGNYGIVFLLGLFLFLVLSALATNIGRVEKQGLGVYEASRGWKNVLSNGGMPAIASLIYFLDGVYGFMPLNYVALGYVASVCAIIADKFASEIGVLDGYPRMLVTMKRVQKGVSGGVTLLGFGASAVGAAVIALTAFLLPVPLTYVAVAFVSGFLGNVVDSLLGYLEEQGVGNKFTSNFLCSAAAFLVALLPLLAFSL